MNVIIDGVEYVPRHNAEAKHGAIKSLARQMADGRAHKGWTIDVAARTIGITRNKIVRAEYGTATIQTIVKLADAYGIPLEEIARAVRRARA